MSSARIQSIRLEAGNMTETTPSLSALDEHRHKSMKKNRNQTSFFPFNKSSYWSWECLSFDSCMKTISIKMELRNVWICFSKSITWNQLSLHAFGLFPQKKKKPVRSWTHVSHIASGCRSLSEGTELKTDNLFVMITSISRLQHFDLRSPLGLRFLYTGQGGGERLTSC